MAKTLVAYFSASGVTRRAAENLAKAAGADLFEIVPEQPYTDADLNWNNNKSRSSLEMNDRSSRPAISGTVENMSQYSHVFVGFPVWWGEEPRIMDTFVESYDFGNIVMIPFCISGGSGIGRSGSNLAENAGSGDWKDGDRLQSNISDSDLQAWIDKYK